MVQSTEGMRRGLIRLATVATEEGFYPPLPEGSLILIVEDDASHSRAKVSAKLGILRTVARDKASFRTAKA